MIVLVSDTKTHKKRFNSLTNSWELSIDYSYLSKNGRNR